MYIERKLTSYYVHSFMLKSKSLEHNPSSEQSLVALNYSEFDVTARLSTQATGGIVFVTATASIDILFVDSLVSGNCDRPQLPFAVTVKNQIIVFDDVDCSPVFEDKSNDYDSLATSVTTSFSGPTISSVTDSPTAAANVCVVVEADASKAFEVKLSNQVLTTVLSQCSTCFGYTLRGLRCKNSRRPLGRNNNVPVWCHHHHS